MSFIKLSIFGTNFEVNESLSSPCTLPEIPCRLPRVMSTYSQWEWVSVSCYEYSYSTPLQLADKPAYRRLWARLVCPDAEISRAPILTSPPPSSAKDQLSGSSVAIKKIMKPFNTPVLAKRTYRELKLLKHIQHENVRRPPAHSLCDAS